MISHSAGKLSFHLFLFARQPLECLFKLTTAAAMATSSEMFSRASALAEKPHGGWVRRSSRVFSTCGGHEAHHHGNGPWRSLWRTPVLFGALTGRPAHISGGVGSPLCPAALLRLFWATRTSTLDSPAFDT